MKLFDHNIRKAHVHTHPKIKKKWYGMYMGLPVTRNELEIESVKSNLFF